MIETVRMSIPAGRVAQQWKFCTVLIILCACAGAEEPSYPIGLNRPPLAGGEYDIECVVERTLKLTELSLPKTAAVVESKKVTLVARMKVVDVTAVGWPRRVILTVDKLVDGENKVIAASGSVFDVQIGEKKTEINDQNGHPVDDSVAAALEMRFFPFAESKVTADDTFGSKSPRKVGESWPMNAELYRKTWIELGWKIDEGALTGEVRLDGTEKVNGVPMLRISSHFEVKNPINPGLSGDLAVLSSEVKVRSDSSLPVDVASREGIHRDYLDEVLHLQDKTSKRESIRELHTSIIETITVARPAQ